MGEKKRTNKILIFVIIILSLALIAGISVGTFLILKSSYDRDTVNSLTYIGILEDGTYYIAKAKNNIRFQIDTTDENSYTLKDSKGNAVETTIKEENNKKMIESKNNYEEGETYTLELTSAHFSEEKLKDAKKLMFKIEEPEKLNYNLAENVKVIDSNIEIQENQGRKTANIANTNINPNDIIILQGENKDYTDAYKVTKIENNIADLETPELADIYSEYDIYKEYNVDFSKIEINEEFANQIRLGVKQMPLYQFLVNEVYAEDDVGVDVKIDNSGDNLSLAIKITAKANGESFLGVKALSNHDLVLKFNIEMGCDFVVDIQKNMNINLDATLTENIEYEIILESTGTIIEGIDSDLSDEDYIKSIQEIVAKLEASTSDETQGKARIGGIEVPTTVPGLNVYFDIYLQTKLGVNIDFTYNQKIEMKQNVGIIINKDGASYYSTASTNDSNLTLEAYGKAELKIGAGFDIGLSIISKDIAHIDIGDELGLYGELFATMKTTLNQTNNYSNSQMIGNMEAGLYVDVNFSAGIDVFFYKKDVEAKLVSKKFPFFQLHKELETSNEASTQTNTNTSNTTNNSQNNANAGNTQDIYLYFINNKMYKDKTNQGENTWDSANEEYCIIDINKDGIDDILVSGIDQNSGFGSTLIYTCHPNEKQIIYLGSIYGYSSPLYYEKTRELVYETVRPSIGSGYLYSLGKIENDKFIETRQIGGELVQTSEGVYGANNEETKDFSELNFQKIN